MGMTTSVTDCYHFFACTHSGICQSYKDKRCKKELALHKKMSTQVRVDTC